MSLEEYTDLSLTQLEQIMTQYQLIMGPIETNLADSRAHQIIYTAIQGIYSIKGCIVWTIKNNIAYVMTYTAEQEHFNDHINIFDAMIEFFSVP